MTRVWQLDPSGVAPLPAGAILLPSGPVAALATTPADVLATAPTAPATCPAPSAPAPTLAAPTAAAPAAAAPAAAAAPPSPALAHVYPAPAPAPAPAVVSFAATRSVSLATPHTVVPSSQLIERARTLLARRGPEAMVGVLPLPLFSLDLRGYWPHTAGPALLTAVSRLPARPPAFSAGQPPPRVPHHRRCVVGRGLAGRLRSYPQKLRRLAK